MKKFIEPDSFIGGDLALKHWSESNFKDQFETSLYMLIKYNYPDIEDLQIIRNDVGVTISFDSGKYSRDEVISTLNKLINIKL